ncbi:hypothetical protein, partial [Bifidobacterium longum]|uniref:hypothetical protein n=1 Tax=Bifidobacterium longum TaxID=216816 RepID=UPI003CFFAE58
PGAERAHSKVSPPHAPQTEEHTHQTPKREIIYRKRGNRRAQKNKNKKKQNKTILKNQNEDIIKRDIVHKQIHI